MSHSKIIFIAYQKAVIFLLIGCLWLNSPVAFALDLDSSSEIFSSTCKNLKEYELKPELRNVVEDYFTLQKFPVSEIVEKHWNILNIDGEIDSALENAVNQVRQQQENLWSKFSSNFNSAKAKDFVKVILNKAFNSEKLKTDLNTLSLRVSNEVAKDLENKIYQSSQQGIKCLNQYAKGKYTSALQDGISKKIEPPPLKCSDTLKCPDPQLNLLVSQKLAGSGIALIVLSQISKNIANQVAKRVLVELGERLLGRIGAATIPVIGEIAGGILIAVDLANSLDGALPEIERNLKKPELKNSIKNEFVGSVQTVIVDKSSDIGNSISSELYSKWQDVRDSYQKIMYYEGRSSNFKKILEKSKYPLENVGALLDECTQAMGENKIIESIDNGKFEEALRLEPLSFVIVENHDLDYLLDYANLSGKQLEKVVEFEIYKHIPPDKLSRKMLDNILSIKDSFTIAKLALLDVHSIQILLNISTDNLIQIAARLTPDNLSDLAQSLENLKQDDINSIIRLLLSDDKLMSNLKYLPDLVKSPNIKDAIAFWKRENPVSATISGFIGMLTFNLGWHFVADKLNIPFSFLVILAVFLVLFLLSFIAFLLWIPLKGSQAILFFVRIISKNFNAST